MLFNHDTCMLKVAFGTLYPGTNNANTPLEKRIKTLTWVFFILIPPPLNELLQLSEELLDKIQIWGVRWERHQLDSCVPAHLSDLFGAVKGRIIHDNYGLRFGCCGGPCHMLQWCRSCPMKSSNMVTSAEP